MKNNNPSSTDASFFRRIFLKTCERPKNGADTQACLSDVYTNGTQAITRQADAPLCGRSMVEMLGVLAIIGVLSVGAIAGYSKAMMKYKLNKQTEQLNQVMNAVARFSKQFHFNELTYLTSYFVKLGEIPKEMTAKSTNPNNFYDVFGNRWVILYLPDNTSSINLGIYGDFLQTVSNENLEICRNMIVTAKENSSNIHYVSFLSDYKTDEALTQVIFGDTACSKGWGTCLKDITLEQIYDLCRAHIGKNGPEFKISWLAN